jgi:hypothetical protein
VDGERTPQMRLGVGVLVLGFSITADARGSTARRNRKSALSASHRRYDVSQGMGTAGFIRRAVTQ